MQESALLYADIMTNHRPNSAEALLSTGAWTRWSAINGVFNKKDCWRKELENSVVECKTSENVCEKARKLWKVWPTLNTKLSNDNWSRSASTRSDPHLMLLSCGLRRFVFISDQLIEARGCYTVSTARSIRFAVRDCTCPDARLLQLAPPRTPAVQVSSRGEPRRTWWVSSRLYRGSSRSYQPKSPPGFFVLAEVDWRAAVTSARWIRFTFYTSFAAFIRLAAEKDGVLVRLVDDRRVKVCAFPSDETSVAYACWILCAMHTTLRTRVFPSLARKLVPENVKWDPQMISHRALCRWFDLTIVKSTTRSHCSGVTSKAGWGAGRSLYSDLLLSQ